MGYSADLSRNKALSKLQVIHNFKEKINFAIRPFDILYHKVELNEAFYKENHSVILSLWAV